MKKKWLSAAAAALLATGLLSGCGNGSTNGAASPKETGGASPSSSAPAAKEPVSIKFLGWEKASVYQPAIDAFQQANPDIKVDYVPLVENDSNETIKKIDLMYASDDDFDVFTLNSAPAFAQRGASGMLEPMDGYLAKEGVKYEDEYKAEQQKLDGKRYSLPGKFGPWMILLNKELLDAANLKVPKSWTWDEFRDYAKKLTKGEGANKTYGAHFHEWKDYFLLKLYSASRDQGIMKDDGQTLNADNPLMKQSLELRYEMEKTDKSATPYQDVITQKIPYRNQFFQQKAAMLPTGPWMVAEAGGTDKIPATFVSAFAPWPTNAAGDDVYSFGGADPLVISSHSKHKEESYRFLRYLSTEGMALTNQFSAWKKADIDQEVDRIVSATQSPDKIDKASLINVLSVTKLPIPPITVSYAGDLEKAYIAEADTYMLGNNDIDKTMASIKANLQKIIDANK
ncbi:MULTISPECIES: extracellular solute-binding protein [unclassified Paenibacillus]|uniref:ABC transporter substrate-binding protein n=1 Tax=unclassified Paenibacillus TaxID=185978 RepID=UPI0009551D8C|nr:MULTISPECIES: extracellular solute-binding protein [unclassified Paenibacillus]ASS68263.2 extracellular solute-binding protein [Paenibacillus sp. RUD330]SIR26451.1 multiple sugar transport system substrate-binding protein [Paenibacillus sp. RU4X]SIR39443.1 multiple sugar transport system substrate-binding protein [Paenibacillus sp. RU4T]